MKELEEYLSTHNININDLSTADMHILWNLYYNYKMCMSCANQALKDNSYSVIENTNYLNYKTAEDQAKISLDIYISYILNRGKERN